MHKIIFRNLLRFALSAFIFAGFTVATAREPSPLERITGRNACEDLVMSYAHALDATDVNLMVPLFAKDGQWDADGKLPVQGSEALRAFWTNAFAPKRPTVGRHVVSNVRTTMTTQDHAQGTAFVTMYRLDPVNPGGNASLSPQLLVALDLEYVRVGGRWLFKRVSLKSNSTATYEHGKS